MSTYIPNRRKLGAVLVHDVDIENLNEGAWLDDDVVAAAIQ
jgi:hypothetical protein